MEIVENAFDLRSARALTLGSGCKIMFIRRETGRIIPVLMLTGIEAVGNKIETLCGSKAHGRVGIIVSEIVKKNNNTTIDTHFKNNNYIQIGPISTESSQGQDQETDWVTIDLDKDKIVYPRVFIRSLNIKTDSNSLVLKYQDQNKNFQSQDQLLLKNKTIYTVLTPYKDYSILTRSLKDEYVLTINNDIVIEQGVRKNSYGGMQSRKIVTSYTISNADTAIYLDALEISKENAEPKVSYEVTPNIFNSKYCNTIYNRLGNIIRINDTDLKFENVRGYISGLTMDLDFPENDVIEVKNYKSKFEDLFSTITAQTEQMKKNNHAIEMATSAFTSSGDIAGEVLQSSIFKVDLDYAFDNGKLTIDENNGIWGTSDTGVVAFRGGGIFTSTQRDIDGNWKWNTGITPEGINASLITSGQLDTNLIKIYAGDHLRFQMNGDGIFAYKSWLNDAYEDQITKKRIHPKGTTEQQVNATSSLDGKQYVKFNEDGLALIAKRGALVLKSNKTQYIEVLDDTTLLKNPSLAELEEIKRVQVSWEGFILRNWLNQKVFYADPQTGNLTLKGRIEADEGHIGIWTFDHSTIWSASGVSNGVYTQFVALNAGGNISDDPEKWNAFTDEDGNPIYEYDSHGEIIYVNGQPKIKKVDIHDYAFWAGDMDPAAASFSIKKDGALKASTGQIGGWIIASNKLTSEAITLYSTTSTITEDFDYQEETDDSKPNNNNNNNNNSSKINSISKDINAVLWVHDGELVSARNSLLYISATGDLCANKLYIKSMQYGDRYITNADVGYYIEAVRQKAASAASTAWSAYDIASSTKTAVKNLEDYVKMQISALWVKVNSLSSSS